jgi:hypothetical protein
MDRLPELADAEKQCVQLREENDRLKAVLAQLPDLPTICWECGETLACPRCGTDGLSYEHA